MKLRVVGVPSAWGSPTLGVVETPRRLRDAGLIEWLAGGGLEVEDAGDVVVPDGRASDPPERPLAHLEQVAAVARSVRRAAEEAIAAGALPLLVGGECALAIGAFPALSGSTRGAPALSGSAAGAPAIAWLDAHGDLNTPDTSPSGLITGMPLAALLGRGHSDLLAVGGDAACPNPADVWLLGGRDLDDGERSALADLSLHHVGLERLRETGTEELAIELLRVPRADVLPPEARAAGAGTFATPPSHRGLEQQPVESLYVHLDVDVIDPSEAPGVCFPVDGGPGAAEIADLLGYLCASGRVGAISVASADLTRDRGGRTLSAIEAILTVAADALALAPS